MGESQGRGRANEAAMEGLTLTPTPETEGKSALLKADSQLQLVCQPRLLLVLRPSSANSYRGSSPHTEQPPPSIPHQALAASSPSYITFDTQASWPTGHSQGLQTTGATETGWSELKTDCGGNQHTSTPL